jgi:hypothetical protein
MRFVHQPVCFVIMLALMQHFTHVHCSFINFEIVDQIKGTIQKVLHPKPKQQSVPTQYTSTHLPTVQPSTYDVPTYIPVSSDGVQQQGEVSTLPQESVNGTLQDGLESRAMIDAPLINGQCDVGYKMTRGRCRRMFGRRRRRR